VVATPRLVGRESELQRLARVLDEAEAGIGRLVLISGEPGVGKTRLAVELVDDAKERGALSAIGACWDGAGAPGLWPWVQVLRSLRTSLGDGAWDRSVGSGRDALTQLIDGEPGRVAGDFDVFEATLQLLTGICADRAVVVLLDDLQWADGASLALIDFLHHHAVQLPLLVVGTYRAAEIAGLESAQRPSIADLAQNAVSVPLTGLDNDGVRAIRADLGISTSTAEAEHLRRLTGGNPFFIIESVAFTDPTESLGVRRAIDRRVAALTDAEQRVITVAALIGRDSPDALVSAVVGLDARVPLATIEAAGLLRARGERHEFVHDLVRETMRDRQSPEDRRALYADIVRAADTDELRSSLLPAQLAWLATQAVPDIDASRAAALLVAAANDAAAGLTYEAAGRHFEDAAALTDEPNERAALLLESGNAYHRAGALASARDCYRGLLTATDVEVRARALLGLHRLGEPAVGERSSVMSELDRVDAALDGTANVALRAEVMAARSRSRAHVLAADRSDELALAADALALAREAGDATTLASCLLAYHDAIWEPGTEAERRRVAAELATIGHDQCDPSMEAQGLLLRMVAEIETGDAAYLNTYVQYEAVAEASRSPRVQFVAASRRGTVAALKADFPRAVAEIDAARALGERIGEPDVVGMWCDQRWQVARHAGDHDAIKGLLDVLRNMGDPHWMIYDAMVAVDRGDNDHAKRLAHDVTVLGERWPRWAARMWHVFNVQLAIADADLARMARLAEQLEPESDRWAVLGGAVLVHGPVAVWLGRLEAARGDWQRALSYATAAEAAALRLDADLWMLEARADRLTAQRVVGTVDADEIASTVVTAAERGLVPIVDRLCALTQTAPDTANVFRLERDIWTLTFDGVEVRMPDAKGLQDLHTLLANPCVEVAATALATSAFVAADEAPVLDAQAKKAYRDRLDHLDAELDRAAVRGDGARAEMLEKERAALLDELRRAAGLGGRDRSMNSDRERLRKTVTARIRDTLRRLDDRHPALAAHLRASVRTGATCVYAPAEPVSWRL
jgi:hypothetical protein